MKNKNNNPHKYTVHHVLAHSYLIQLILFLIAVCFDLVFKLRFYTNSLIILIGFLGLIFGTILILWAQRTSQNLKINNINKATFCNGPYCYTRTPTHWGLFLLILGFGLMVNAPLVILSAFISFLISKYMFLNKEEKILEEKYGIHYVEYKKSVTF